MTCALVFADVVDSTRLVERLGDARAAEVWAAHDRRSRDLLARHHGREIDRSDGFFLLFDEAADAARFALAYHEAIADLALDARVGIHVGPVTLRENAPEDIARGAKRIEVEGIAKPLAARVMALACGGQTLMSAPARGALGDNLPEPTEIESHGFYRLKGVEEPVEIFELGIRDSSPFAPPADVDKAYRVVRAGDFWRPVREVRHNLPAERDAFIGRTTELHALASRLDAGARLLTVLGPGGTGKTRCVRRYGWSWLGDWPGGVAFCDLSEARSLEAIVFAVASALGVPLGKADPVVQIGHAIAGRGRCLVILDNFEQIVAHAAATLGHWLDRARDAAFVVTSRERLHLQGEEVFPIEPLPIEHDAIELFASRARAQQPDFALTDANRAAVAEVVQLLDGLPLAIELAAARVRVLAPARLVERLHDRFALLGAGRGPVQRQATLRAAIDWSWELLAPWEQAALAQCSVFDGGFTLEAAEAVLDCSAWPQAPPPIDAIQALVDKSLLRTWVPAGQGGRYAVDEPYFGMYLSIHEYAAEKLGASGVAQTAAQDRHAAYYAGFGSDSAVERLSRHAGVKLRRALALELGNLVVACRHAVQCGHGEVAAASYRAVWEVLELHGPQELGAGLGDRVLGLPGLGAAARAQACVTRSQAARRAGQMDAAAAWLDEALALLRQTGQRAREAGVLRLLGIVQRQRGRMQEALAYYQRALAIRRATGDRRGEGSVLGNLGIVHCEQGRMDEGREHFERALAIDREAGDRMQEGITLNNLGVLQLEQGHGAAAQPHFEAALAIHREVGNRHEEGVVLANLGALHLGQGRFDESRGHLEAALTVAREVGGRRLEGVVLGDLGELLRCQGQVAQARTFCDLALTIHREVGNRRYEGAVLCCLAEIALRQGQPGEARQALVAGEALLRGIGDRLGLGKLLCTRGHAELAAGDSGLARAALADAQAAAQAIGARADSELGHAIDLLRAAIDGASESE